MHTDRTGNGGNTPPPFPKPLDPDTTGESARFKMLEAMVIALAEEAR